MNKARKILSFILDKINPKRAFVSNLYGKDFSKRVLISYITHPFIRGLSGHSNTQEAIKIADIFNEMEYVVDLLNYNTNFEKIDFKYNYYDIVFGLEPNFLKAVDKFKPEKSIYYATGSYYAFQNEAEKKRLYNLEKRKGKLLSPVRLVVPHESSEKADAVICIGNEKTKETYASHCKKIECIRVSAHSFFPFNILEKDKDWDESRKSFLWFGSSGSVHKGLDLLLDIFKKEKSLDLFVAGSVLKEKDFVNLYKEELFNCSNIKFLGFIDPKSKEFKDVVTKCAFVIMPSCSEGMNSSVPTCMHAGLIPLVSRESGLDVGSVGVIFDNNDLDTIRSTIKNCSEKDLDWIMDKSKNSYEFAKNNFTLETFQKDFQRALKNIL